MELRDYQEDMIVRTRQALRRNKRIILQAPTGAGKTALAVHMMAGAATNGKRTMFIVHQRELMKQTSGAFWKQKLEHGIIASDRGRSPQLTQVASLQTLVNRLDHYEAPDLIIIDEAHRSAAETYRRIIAKYEKARVVGLTATPERTDGKGLNVMYDDIVLGPSMPWMIQNRWLCDYELFGVPSDLDLSDVGTVAGDYNKGQLEKAVDKPKIVGDAVDHYIKHGENKRAAVMCVSIKHAESVARLFGHAGVSAAFLHSGLSDTERDRILDEYAAGTIRVLTAVNLLIEGLDVPEIGVIIWLRPTKSLIVYMQGNGRGFRSKGDGGKLKIFDHVGNWQRHRLPDDDREWSLQGRKKGSRKQSDEADIGIQQCGACYMTFRAGVTACPSCGAAVEFKERVIEVVEGVLFKIDKAEASRVARREQGGARTIDDLVAIGLRRGMKNPAGWAANVYSARSGHRASANDHHQARQAMARIVSQGHPV